MSTFNKYASKGAYHYDWYETEDWYKYLIDRAVKFCRGFTIDLGGGDGLLANKIIQNGYDAVVMDSDNEGLKLANQNGVLLENCILLDLDTDFSKYGRQYDYLACINAIEHFNKPENVKHLINNNTLKGAIITTIDYQGGTLGEDHKFEWTYEQMMDFFREFKPKGFRYKDTEWIGVEIKK